MDRPYPNDASPAAEPAAGPPAAPPRPQIWNEAQFSEQIRQEFRDEAQELIGALDMALAEAARGARPMATLVDETRRGARRLRGQAAAAGWRLVAAVAHRMEDYLRNAHDHVPPRTLEDLQRFFDTLQDILSSRVSAEIDAAALVRGLPAKAGFDVGDVDIREVEVMLVMERGAQSHYVERELQQCGYRTTVVRSTFDALPLIVRTRPDLVVLSAVMPELSGIDLAMALVAMPETRNIPTALITSLAADDSLLALLPASVPVIQKGPSFADDLFAALDRLFLL